MRHLSTGFCAQDGYVTLAAGQLNNTKYVPWPLRLAYPSMWTCFVRMVTHFHTLRTLAFVTRLNIQVDVFCQLMQVY